MYPTPEGQLPSQQQQPQQQSGENNDKATASATAAESNHDTTEQQEQKEQQKQDPRQEDWQIQRDAGKQLGDAAFRKGEYGAAIESYSAALSLDPDSAVVLSNRSAAYLKNNEKSKALRDAEACVRIGTMKTKGHSRLAAALQSLGRHDRALEHWSLVVKDDPTNQAAQRGVEDCRKEVDRLKKEQEAEAEAEKQQQQAEDEEEDKADKGDDGGDGDLDDFFDDVETAATQVHREKEMAAAAAALPVPTNAIKNSKKGLGTVGSQIDRLLQENHKWRNLNPFYVLDVPHTASVEEISKRYKALSLLLHPDKNQGDQHERAQLAYDEVLRVKAMLDDENKASHCRQLAEQGTIRGKAEWEQHQKEKRAGKPITTWGNDANVDNSLGGFQSRAVQKVFAEVEYRRREVEKRERNQEQRERQQEEEVDEKARNERKFDKNWKQEERVDKRIGSWRQFQQKKKSKN